MSQIVGLVALPNDGRPGNSMTRTDGILSSRPVISQVARQVGMKDEDGLRFAVPSRPGLLAVPPPGPTGDPGRLRTLFSYFNCYINNMVTNT